MLVPKVKPPALLTVHSAIRFPKSVSYDFDLSVFFSKCLLRTSHGQGNEERDLVFKEPTIQRDTKSYIAMFIKHHRSLEKV